MIYNYESHKDEITLNNVIRLYYEVVNRDWCGWFDKGHSKGEDI